jgi:ribosome-binding factor A
MKANRITRVNEIIRRELATQLYRIIHRPDFDPAEVTITHVVTAVDLRTAKVMVSVRGDAAEGERVLHILKAARAEFQEALRDNVMLRYTPHLQFVRDTSVAEGDRVLQLIAEMGLEREEGMQSNAVECNRLQSGEGENDDDSRGDA